MAHKKGQGSSRNGRDSQPKMLGVKRFAGQYVTGGSILVRQAGHGEGRRRSRTCGGHAQKPEDPHPPRPHPSLRRRAPARPRILTWALIDCPFRRAHVSKRGRATEKPQAKREAITSRALSDLMAWV